MGRKRRTLRSWAEKDEEEEDYGSRAGKDEEEEDFTVMGREG